MINRTIKDKLLTYVTTAISADATFGSVEMFGPNAGEPDVEKRTDPLITIDLMETLNRQFDLGSRTTRKTGMVVVTLFVREGTGLNLVSEFKGLMDSIGLERSSGITYKEPVEIGTPKQYKGWAPTSVALPFMLENFVV